MGWIGTLSTAPQGYGTAIFDGASEDLIEALQFAYDNHLRFPIGPAQLMVFVQSLNVSVERVDITIVGSMNTQYLPIRSVTIEFTS